MAIFLKTEGRRLTERDLHGDEDDGDSAADLQNLPTRKVADEAHAALFELRPGSAVEGSEEGRGQQRRQDTDGPWNVRQLRSAVPGTRTTDPMSRSD